MDNRDIFNFDFVDRIKQQQILMNFINSSENYLWIDGESGVGKSFFVKRKLLTHTRFQPLYINLSTETEKNNCLNEIIQKLQEFSDSKLLNFIMENYTSIWDVAKKTVFELIKLKTQGLEWFLDILFNSNIVFVSKSEEKSTSLKIVECYIKKIINSRNLCIVIDNFTYCDKKSLMLLSQLFYHYIDVSNFKVILVTTSNVLNERLDIQILLTEQLPVKRMKINALDNVKYFHAILDSVFELDAIADFIPDIYTLCSGNPERLKSLIRKLYLNDGIYLPKSDYTRAKINSDMLKKLLLKGTFELSYADFNENERFIILVLLGFGGLAELNVLQKCVIYIHNQLFGGNLWTPIVINNLIQGLIAKNIFESIGEINQKISFSHDKIFFGMQMLYEDDINRPLISHYFYDFLADNNCSQIQDADYLKIQHAFIAQTSSWREENYQYGYQKYLQKKFFDAVPIFKRILKANMPLTVEKIIVLGETFYETGDYFNAKSLLKNNAINSEDDFVLCHYYILMGKTENLLMYKDEAIEAYDTALKYAQNRETQIRILNLKHLALLETPTGKEKAKEIFDSIALNLTDTEKNMLSVCYLLRNCNQFYTGAKAREFFELALDISVKQGSLIDEAYVHNNYGLELFRTYYLSEAYEKFKISYQILSDTKFHEASYPLNNMAVCEMFKGNYTQAVEYLTEGHYLNQSIYAGLAIKVHLMTCYRMLRDEEHCRKYIYQLENYLNTQNISDLNIIRKLSINLCISYLEYKENEHALECLKKCLPYISGTISEYRGAILNNQLNDTKIDYSKAMQSNLYYTRLDFEPWVITLSHD